MLAKTLETSIGWTSIQYGYITGAFQAAYAIGLLGGGYLMDRLGTRKGYSIAVSVWSLAAIAHALATSAFSFGVARSFLGLGEAANFPACIKTVAEWFPKKERALAAGIFNAGTNVGAVVAPLTVPWLALTFGWQMAFVATGALGFVWLIFWLLLYHKPETHPRISSAELAHIQSDPADPEGTVSWMSLLPRRETWAFILGKFLTDPVWWFYLFWLPKYLQEKFGLGLMQIVWPTLIVYNAASIGSVGGGWLSSRLIKGGLSINSARKTVMLICALCMLPVLYTPFSTNLWLVVALFSLATAAHQGWSANLFTLPSDMFPRRAVGSVVGIGATGGAIGGVLIQITTGYVVQRTHSYLPLFLFAGVAYVAALAIIQWLSPNLEPITLS
jgi:MFS transporter, ACS family, hexuronate transporter